MTGKKPVQYLFLFDLGKRVHFHEERRRLRTGKCDQEDIHERT
jgi:hypothetical protein